MVYLQFRMFGDTIVELTVGGSIEPLRLTQIKGLKKPCQKLLILLPVINSLLHGLNLSLHCFKIQFCKIVFL